ncbi:hypothetical protein CHU92_02485 [Flavobacterium cyanobacteriorum]|uniref:Uncharacterized protein n=1 Tax=Flavobacterium cyanobacteriorum TaxID=2022802 RepID=A0A255ZSK5_9FLAO|nr:hypothetical protein [Flavobacterium cyanobacteriorum]OYQ44369.1 hypothetical protein CHU92_02485 [Flavobacterium cyanobacteriorum]
MVKNSIIGDMPVTLFKALKFVHPLLFIYWLGSKFINVQENVFFGIVYEMSALLFVLFTVAVPLFVIVYWIINKGKLNKTLTVQLLLHLVFSGINIVVMTLDPANFTS